MHNMQLLTESTRLLSPALWGKLPIDAWSLGIGGRFHFNDFDRYLTAKTPDKELIGTGCSIVQPSLVGGAITLTHDGNANDEVGLKLGDDAGGSFTIDATAGKILAFECRVKKSEIAQNVLGFFVGLSKAASLATGFMANTTGALVSTADVIGFHVPMGTSGAIANFVAMATGQTMVSILAAAHTFVADTFVKLGFRFDPTDNPSTKRVTIFVNNVAAATFVTQTQIAAATFPAGIKLSPHIHTKAGSSAAASSATMDWWAIGQSE